jgi:hypothetical protein
MWHHAGEYLSGLLYEASPRAIVLVLQCIRRDRLTDREDLIQRWGAAASAVTYTEEIAQSVVDTLLQIASEEELLPYIPANVWSWLTKRPHLPPICLGRSIGTCPHVLKAVRALKDVEVLKSYLFLVWSEWNMPRPRAPQIPDSAPIFRPFPSPHSAPSTYLPSPHIMSIIYSPTSSYGVPTPRLPRARHSMLARHPPPIPYITCSLPTLPPPPVPYAIGGRPFRHLSPILSIDSGPIRQLSPILSIDSGPIHQLSPTFSTNSMPIRPPSPIPSIIDSISSSRSSVSRDRTSSPHQLRQSADSFPAPRLRRVLHSPVPPSPPILYSISIPPPPPALDNTSIPPSPPILGNTSILPSPPILGSTSSIHSSTSYYNTSVRPQSVRFDSGSIRTPPRPLGITDSSHLSDVLFDMWISVQEDFGGSGMGHHRTELLQRLDHVLMRLDRGSRYLKYNNPELDEDYLRRATFQYNFLREALLETDIRAISRTSCSTIMPLCILTPSLDGHRIPRNIYVCTSSPMSIVSQLERSTLSPLLHCLIRKLFSSSPSSLACCWGESIWASPIGCPVGTSSWFHDRCCTPSYLFMTSS